MIKKEAAALEELDTEEEEEEELVADPGSLLPNASSPSGASLDGILAGMNWELDFDVGTPGPTQG